jgi:hydroxymethylbilane synthase
VETEWTASGEGSNSKEELRMKAVVVSLDGAEAVEADERKVVANREEAEEFGKYVAKMLIQRGAGKILEEINKVRHVIAPERVGD